MNGQRKSAARFFFVFCLIMNLSLCSTRKHEAPRPLFVIVQDGRWGLTDRTGMIVTKPEFDLIDEFSNGFAAANRAQMWGYLDDTGKVAIRPRFDIITKFKEDLAAVKCGGKWGFTDKSGRVVGGFRFDDAHPFFEGLASVQIRGKWAFVNKKMALVIKPEFDWAWDFSEGLAPVRIGKKWGYINKNGKMVIEPQFYWVDNFAEGLAYVEGGEGKAGYIDKNGKFIIRKRYWGAHPFSDGLAAVQPDPGGKWGLIDKFGKMIIDPKFDKVGLFCEGLAAVQVNFKEGYLNKAGMMIIPAQFNRADNYFDGLAQVTKERRLGYIDKTGKYVLGPYDMGLEREADPTLPARHGSSSTELITARIEGGQIRPPKTISLVGNPFRKRFPDGTAQVFARNVWDMFLYQDRIYLGSGDFWNNTGPADIYSFVPGGKDFFLEYQAPDEMVSSFYDFAGKLVIPGNDPMGSWDLGNIYIKEKGRWRKVRTIPNGLHCFELAWCAGDLYAVVLTDGGSKVLESKDWGTTWTALATKSVPHLLFPLGGSLCGLDSSGRFYTLENSIFFGHPMAPERRGLLGFPSFSDRKYFNKAIPFAHGVVLFPPFFGQPSEGLYFLQKQEGQPLEINVFSEWCPMDGLNRGDTFYVICTRQLKAGFENGIYSTRDLKSWQCVATFITETFARSFEENRGEFYVGLGCFAPVPFDPTHEKPQPLSRTTGDILRVIPAR